MKCHLSLIFTFFFLAVAVEINCSSTLEFKSPQDLLAPGDRLVPAATNHPMVSSSSYAPNESYSTTIREELWLQGSLLGNFLFGIQTTLCVFAFLAVLRRTIKHNRMRVVLLVYIAVLFAITTLAQAFMLDWIQMAFITQRNYPGGPDAFLNDTFSMPIRLAPEILSVFANWMMECLFVWRCYVVCNTGERLWWLGSAIPLPLLIVVFVWGSLLVYHTFQKTTITTYVIGYGASTLALNLVVTGFIAGRLLVHRHRVVSQLGRAYGEHYASITTVVVESAAVYTGALVILIVAYAMGSPATILLRQVSLQVQSITSFFLIWRIARGWTRPTDTAVVSAAVSSLSMRVGPPPQPNVIQLEALPTRRDDSEVEEGSIRQEKEGKNSFPKGGVM